MLSPKKVKHRKWHKSAGESGGVFNTRCREVNFGEFGLKSTEGSRITSRQIEAARRVLVRYIRKGGKVWTRIFPDKPITLHGSETKMGKGKGMVDHYAVFVKPGTVMFEISGVDEKSAKEGLIFAGHKLPVKNKVVKR
ncbi:MAG: 50S ribosomal protein L16 [Patescibacteria group bacterium]|nr:50S ribosomal protein L16 [Patescibacteria group bacterium]